MQPNSTPGLYTLDASLSRSEVLDELAGTPATLRALCLDQPTSALTAPPSPGDWSAFQTICHFRDAALVYALRFRFMVFDEDPFLPSYSEDRWVAASKDRPADLPAILDEVAASRAGLVRVLSRLEDSDWQRTGRHEAGGSLVLEDYVRHELAHERMHLEQIRAALSRDS
jgi:hypothetical protein